MESREVQTHGNPLLKAVYLSRLRLTRLLLEGGAYINESNKYGETPLMVACKSRHTDPQCVPKHRLVQYLLENGADPNIQDKMGKTALMHACLEQSGTEILSLLLSSGADPTLEDHTGLSALVYAVNSGNRDMLRVLLDACKAKGKEVIIITTNKLPSGHQMTRQYFNVPPPPDLEEHLQYTPTSCCLGPNQVQGYTDPSQCLDSGPGLVTSRPGSPTQHPSPLHVPGVDKRPPLQKLHSEHWSKCPSLLLQQSQASTLTEEAVEMLLKARADMSENEKGGEGWRRSFGRKMSHDSAASSPHSASHPNLHQGSLLFTHESRDSSESLRHYNVSSLQNVVHLRNIGIDHYSSDSQLLQFGRRDSSSMSVGGGGVRLENQLVNSRSSTLSGSRESLVGSVQRRGAAPRLERRGSSITHSRPGYLPPLNPHAPIPDIGVGPSSSYPLSGSSKTLNGALRVSKPVPACAPVSQRDLKAQKMLWRRHSMQSEQIRQLVNFQDH